MIRTQEMERDVLLVSDHPAVVRIRRHVEQLARPKLEDSPIGKRNCRSPSENKSNVLNRAEPCSDGWSNVLRPFPPGLVGRASDRDATEMDELEAALGHLPDLVGFLEPLEDDFGRRRIHVPLMGVSGSWLAIRKSRINS